MTSSGSEPNEESKIDLKRIGLIDEILSERSRIFLILCTIDMLKPIGKQG